MRRLETIMLTIFVLGLVAVLILNYPDLISTVLDNFYILMIIIIMGVIIIPILLIIFGMGYYSVTKKTKVEENTSYDLDDFE